MKIIQESAFYGCFGLVSLTFDDDGWVRKIYTVDSNDGDMYTTKTNRIVGIEATNLSYFDANLTLPYKGGNPESLNNVNPVVWQNSWNPSTGQYFPIFRFISFDLGTELWKKYLKEHDQL